MLLIVFKHFAWPCFGMKNNLDPDCPIPGPPTPDVPPSKIKSRLKLDWYWADQLSDGSWVQFFLEFRTSPHGAAPYYLVIGEAA